MPSVKDGETRGFKFYGIRPGSLPKLLNIKNGDLITSVNGTDLKSVDGAMSLYTKLRRASNLSITIERKGETINKEITIQ
jgi:type II secretory pathway component PulC